MAVRQLWLRTVIDSVHALSAGVTPGVAAALWVVRGGAQASLDPVAFAGIVRGWTTVLVVPVAAIVLLVATGLARLSHRTAHLAPAAIGPKSRAALIEHAVFVALFGGSIVLIFALIQP